MFCLGHDPVQRRSPICHDHSIHDQVRIKNCGESIAGMARTCTQPVHQPHRNQRSRQNRHIGRTRDLPPAVVEEVVAEAEEEGAA